METVVTDTNTGTGQRLYKSTQPSLKYIFTDGTVANFIRGEYVTTNEVQIAHLDREIALNHPLIYIDPKERFVSRDRLDPIHHLRARMRAELEAEIREEMARATNPHNDMGRSNQGRLNPQSTRDIAPVTISSGSITAELAKIANSPAKK